MQRQPAASEGKRFCSLRPGTSTLLVRRHDGLNWAVLVNTHQNSDGKTLSSLIDPLIHPAADAVGSCPEP